jgi:hypothetical protein
VQLHAAPPSVTTTVEKLVRHGTLALMSPRRTPFPFPPQPRDEFPPRRELADPFALINEDVRELPLTQTHESRIEVRREATGIAPRVQVRRMVAEEMRVAAERRPRRPPKKRDSSLG